MSKVILDASAMLALIKNETGATQVEQFLGRIVMSSINISEVASILLDSPMTQHECKECLELLINNIVAFDAKQALIAADLRKSTKAQGLSLGDRACLTLGLVLGLPVYTADQIWSTLTIPDLKIHLIR